MSKINFLSRIYLILCVPVLFFIVDDTTILLFDTFEIPIVVPIHLLVVLIVASLITFILVVEPKQHPIPHQRNTWNDLLFRNITTLGLQMLVMVYGMMIMQQINPLADELALTGVIYGVVAWVIVPFIFDLTYLKIRLSKRIIYLLIFLQLIFLMFLTTQILSYITPSQNVFSQRAIVIISVLAIYSVGNQLKQFTPLTQRVLLEKHLLNVQGGTILLGGVLGIIVGYLIGREIDVMIGILSGIVAIIIIELLLWLLVYKPILAFFLKLESQDEFVKALREEKYQQLPKLINKYLNLNYNYREAYNISFAYLLLGEVDESLEFMKNEVKPLLEKKTLSGIEDFFCSHFLAHIGYIYLSHGNFGLAKKYLDSALAHPNISIDAYPHMAFLNIHNNKLSDAQNMINTYKISVLEQGDHANYWCLVAYLEQKKGNPDKADEYLEKTRETVKYSLQKRNYHIYKGLIHQDRHELNKAQHEFERLLNSPPNTFYHRYGQKLISDLSPQSPVDESDHVMRHFQDTSGMMT